MKTGWCVAKTRRRGVYERKRNSRDRRLWKRLFGNAFRELPHINQGRRYWWAKVEEQALRECVDRRMREG